MTRRILIVPTSHGAGLTGTCLGLMHALDQRRADVGYIKPLAQNRPGGEPDHSPALVRLVSTLIPPEPISEEVIADRLSHGAIDTLMEEVIARSEPVLDRHDIVIVEGLVPSDEQTYSGRLNLAMAKALDADVLMVGSALRRTPEHVADRMAAMESAYRAGEYHRVIGAVITRISAGLRGEALAEYERELAEHDIRVVASVPFRSDLTWPRVADLVRQMNLRVLNAGEQNRRIRDVAIAAQSVAGVLPSIKEGLLLLVPGDRHEIILAASLATMNGTRLAAVLLTAGVTPDERVIALCQPAMSTGLPVLLTEEKTFETASGVIGLDPELPVDDEERTRRVMEAAAASFDEDWLASIPLKHHRRRMSPAAFRYEIASLAKAANKRIVLPEGSEPRTVQAAAICAEQGMARCVLLARPEDVEATASSLGIWPLPLGVEIVDPTAPDERYVNALVFQRRHKGMTVAMARDQLGDTVVLGTIMLHLDEVDGLVSGAVHTTANTVRPAMQIIGTKPGAKLVSSVYFMGLPDEVVTYSDCAINPNPNAAELADIAIQSADSAAAFGIDPRIAMISFSTGTSGSGEDVAKVTEATRLVRQLRPDLVVDGPLQYDAAATASVARTKAPGSNVAGQATVFVFPDLNTGNTTSKAVQRSADVISVGPVLQGIAKPVNDLSRGAPVDDIVYTIAITAVQAAQSGQPPGER
ncbi:MAG TPA: phosphate acetyltransferase [Dermatophilaceae bacterium]|nr:phosphate acetyltransferase [Dermatophilaceae bacterium]